MNKLINTCAVPAKPVLIYRVDCPHCDERVELGDDRTMPFGYIIKKECNFCKKDFLVAFLDCGEQEIENEMGKKIVII